ncbi:hypothetical protein VNO78_16276 [Psophocarpus tetragonolobus]|uniref:Uncharacterized protein n=1 Tax=Psophocarpus tetragonolobus TaxID=3891 RepID=A0AAN9SFJ7_PSOTE
MNSQVRGGFILGLDFKWDEEETLQHSRRCSPINLLRWGDAVPSILHLQGGIVLGPSAMSAAAINDVAVWILLPLAVASPLAFACSNGYRFHPGGLKTNVTIRGGMSCSMLKRLFYSMLALGRLLAQSLCHYYARSLLNRFWHLDFS